MKLILTGILILATSHAILARAIRTWSDKELFEKSDLIVIATPSYSADTKEHIGLPGLPDQRAVGVETRFDVSTVVKGDKELKGFVLHHYKTEEPLIDNGPDLIAFKLEEKRTYLLHLIKEADGRYAPTVGQVDPAYRGITEITPAITISSTDPSPRGDFRPIYELIQTQMFNSGPDGKSTLTVYVLIYPDGTRPKVFQTFGSKEMENYLSGFQPKSIVQYDANGFLPPVDSAKFDSLREACLKRGISLIPSNSN